MTETGKRIKTLLNNEIKPAVLTMIDCLADWYKMAQTIYLQTDILEHDLNEQNDHLEKIRGKLFILKEDIKTRKEESPSEPVETKPAVNNNARKKLTELCILQADIQRIVRENADLMKQGLNLSL